MSMSQILDKKLHINLDQWKYTIWDKIQVLLGDIYIFFYKIKYTNNYDIDG